MAQEKQIIEGPVQVGHKTGYQIESRMWNGTPRLSARVGKLYVNKSTGQPGILPEFDLYSFDEFLKAARKAKQRLDQVSAQMFHNQVANVIHQQQPAQSPQQPQWSQPYSHPLQPLSSFPKGDE